MKRNELWRSRNRASATIGFSLLAGIVAVSLAYATAVYAQHRMPGQPVKEDRNHPWMNASLSPDERADMVLKEMTLDEKIDLLHGMGMPGWPREVQHPEPELGNGGAGFVLGVPRLGIPFIQMSDAAYGVRNSADNGRYSTAMPSNVGAAASWDTGSGVRVRNRDRKGAARAGIQHDAGRRREYYARAEKRKNV